MWKKYYVLDGLNGVAKHFLVDSENENIEKVYGIYEKSFLLRVKEVSVLQRIKDVLYRLEVKLESDKSIDDFYVNANEWLVEDLQQFFEENGINNVYMKYVDDYVFQSDLEHIEEWYVLRLTFSFAEPFELKPVHTLDERFVFRYWDGDSFRCEEFEAVSFAYLSDDFVSLGDWNGRDVRIHRIWSQKEGFYELYKAKYVAVQTSDSHYLLPVISDVIFDDDDLQYVLRCYNRVGRGYEELVHNIGKLDMRSAKEVFILKNKPNQGEHVCLFETEKGEYVFVLGAFDYETKIIELGGKNAPPEVAVFKEKEAAIKRLEEVFVNLQNKQNKR